MSTEKHFENIHPLGRGAALDIAAVGVIRQIRGIARRGLRDGGIREDAFCHDDFLLKSRGVLDFLDDLVEWPAYPGQCPRGPAGITNQVIALRAIGPVPVSQWIDDDDYLAMGAGISRRLEHAAPGSNWKPGSMDKLIGNARRIPVIQEQITFVPPE
ncbi:MAG TPA: hypothetical protein VFQ99_05125 [Gallionella sp.]|nr:hypothetical protein [Gallionella sp.]